MSLRVSFAPHIHDKTTTSRIMWHVMIAMLPCVLMGIYRFGWYAAVVLLLSTVSAIAAEYLWQRLAKQPITVSDGSAAVTGLMLGLNLPSTAPWWLPILGSFIAILLVKQLFGGIGDNFMNPALTARAVLLASWPTYMTAFSQPVNNLLSVDTVTTATPLATQTATIPDLLFGNVAGCIGEVSKIMIVIGFVYLLITRVIRWEIPVFMVGTVALLSWLLGADPLYAVLSGGVLFGAVFMATDYTTSPMYIKGQIVYAIGIGIIIVVIRQFGAYPEGVTYAILLMNIATPLLDRIFKNKTYGEVKSRGTE